MSHLCAFLLKDFLLMDVDSSVVTRRDFQHLESVFQDSPSSFSSSCHLLLQISFPSPLHSSISSLHIIQISDASSDKHCIRQRDNYSPTVLTSSIATVRQLLWGQSYNTARNGKRINNILRLREEIIEFGERFKKQSKCVEGIPKKAVWNGKGFAIIHQSITHFGSKQQTIYLHNHSQQYILQTRSRRLKLHALSLRNICLCSFYAPNGTTRFIHSRDQTSLCSSFFYWASFHWPSKRGSSCTFCLPLSSHSSKWRPYHYNPA